MAANPNHLQVVRDVGRRDILFCIALVPGSSRAFLGSSDFRVYDIDLGKDKPEAKEVGKHASYVTGVALAGGHVVSGGYDGKLIWWDTDKHTQVRAIDAHQKWIRKVLATPDGRAVASVADDMVCRIWDAASGQKIHELRGHREQTPHHFPSMLYAVAVSADGKFLATGDKVGHIVVWELASGKQAATLEAPEMYTWDPVQRKHSIGGLRALAFSPDGTLLAAGGIGKIGNIDHLDGKARVEVFDWQKGQRTHTFASDRFKGLVNVLVFHPQGDWLLGAGGAGDGFVQFLDLKLGKPIKEEKLAMHVHDLARSDDAATLYAVGHQKIVVLGMKE